MRSNNCFRHQRRLKVFAVVLTGMISANAAQPLRAQTFAEWFNQKKTQKKYLLQQIAALQAYSGYLRQGYRIAGQGINTVRAFTNGEFDLHQVFFGSLSTVSSAVRNGPETKWITGEQEDMLQSVKHARSVLSRKELPPEEEAYIRAVYDNLLKVSAAQLAAVESLMNERQLQMNDGERLRRLQLLAAGFRERKMFAAGFTNALLNYIMQRSREEKAIKDLQLIYGHP